MINLIKAGKLSSEEIIGKSIEQIELYGDIISKIVITLSDGKVVTITASDMEIYIKEDNK